MSNEKKYGLIVREKQNTELIFQASRNVFGSDDESDDDAGKKNILLQSNANSRRQSKLTQEKAVTEDPTVYQYDEIYDSMTKEKEIKKVKTSHDKKPKYIENLLKTANKRKLENERRVERQVQKEREKEGDEFADKEVFVTSAYKKKLEEMHMEEEKEKYQDYLESIGDVTRQNDLGGFYRHLYEQKLGSDKNNKVEEKNNTNNDEEGKQDVTDNSKCIETKEEPKLHKLINTQTKQRNYRKRKSSNDKKLSEGEIEDSEDEIKFANLDEIKSFKKSKITNIDADSDFSIDDSSTDDESNEKTNELAAPDKTLEEVTKRAASIDKAPKQKTPPPTVTQEKPKVKIDIWKKRTVGEVFEMALKRYYERKATRCA